MIEYHLNTRVDGYIAITSAFHHDKELQRKSALYKFLWVRDGQIDIEVDHVRMTLLAGDIIPLTPFHHLVVDAAAGDYLTVVFNSNFYCIFGHDDEVSCNGFLFHGSGNLMRLHLTETETKTLRSTVEAFVTEMTVRDNLQEEMLRILLKRFIIICTRIARARYGIDEGREKTFDIVRRFYVLVDNHYKEKKQVRDYADMLCRSPKTLSNLFASYELPSPLHIIHERIESEAKRLLLYSDKNAKSIASIIGFEDQASFSRFFKKMTGKSVSDYKRENI